MSLQNTSKIVDRCSLFLNPSTSNIEQGLTNDDFRYLFTNSLFASSSATKQKNLDNQK